MTDDKALADAVVELGVGLADNLSPRGFIPPGCVLSISPTKFVRDSRVAMALMERCKELHWYRVKQYNVWTWTGDQEKTNPTKGFAGSDSLPRAIVDSCAQALREDGK